MTTTDLEKPIAQVLSGTPEYSGPVSSFGSLVPATAAPQGVMAAFPSMLQALGPIGAIYSVLSLIKGLNDSGRVRRMEEAQARDREIYSAANEKTRLENLRQNLVNLYSKIEQASYAAGVMPPSELDIIKSNIDKGIFSEEDLQKLNSFDLNSYIPLAQQQRALQSQSNAQGNDLIRQVQAEMQQTPGSESNRDLIMKLNDAVAIMNMKYDDPGRTAALQAYQQKYNTANPVNQIFPSQMSQQQIQDIAQPVQPGTPGGPSLYGANPPAGAVAGNRTTVQPSQGAGQGSPVDSYQQNVRNQLMSIFGGSADNDLLSQIFQGAGIGVGNNLGLNPALGGVVGAGLGQIGSAFRNLLGGSQTGQNQQSQPPGQPWYYNNPQVQISGVNTGDEYKSQNVLSELFKGLGVENPAQLGLGAGILGLGQALNKDIQLPDFWDDRGVKALEAFSSTANHPLDENVRASIQRTRDITNQTEKKRLDDLYRNARPGADYLNDSAYQRDYANLTRKLALDDADAFAQPQLESNRQNIGVLSNLAEGSVGQGRIQGLLDTAKQTSQNKLFGDLASIPIQSSFKKQG